MKKFRDLLAKDIESAKVIIAGLPFDDHASVGKGSALAPLKIRKLSADLPPFSRDGIDLRDFPIFDYGDFSSNDFSEITLAAQTLFKRERFLLFIGGDHSYTIPLIPAFIQDAKKRKKTPVLIHIDAHPDICDVYHGSMFSHACPVRRSIDAGIKTENIVLIGIRGYEAQEVSYFKEHPEISVFNASTLLKDGIDRLLARLAQYQKDEYDVYLSYDIDANDPSYAPGTGTPEAFGLPAPMTLEIILSIIAKLNVRAMDLMEVAPPLDTNDLTTWLALKTIYEIFACLKEKEKTAA